MCMTQVIILIIVNRQIISARKKPLLKNHHKKNRLRLATAHRNKDRTFLRNVPWSDETKMAIMAIKTIVMFGGKRGMFASRRTPSQPGSTGVAASCCHVSEL